MLSSITVHFNTFQNMNLIKLDCKDKQSILVQDACYIERFLSYVIRALDYTTSMRFTPVHKYTSQIIFDFIQVVFISNSY